MYGLRAADETDGRKPESVFVVTVFRRLDERRIVRKTEIVIGAEIEDARRFGGVYLTALRRGDDPLFLPQSAFLYLVQNALKIFQPKQFLNS